MVRKSTPVPQPKTLKVSVHIILENNSRFVRGKSRSLKEIEDYIFAPYDMRKPDPKGCEYQLTIPYETEQVLDATIEDILL
jgi:hypothetical protein